MHSKHADTDTHVQNAHTHICAGYWAVNSSSASFIWDMTHSYGTWLIHMGHDSFIWDMTHCIGHDSLYWTIKCRDMTGCMGQDSVINDMTDMLLDPPSSTWLVCDMNHYMGQLYGTIIWENYMGQFIWDNHMGQLYGTWLNIHTRYRSSVPSLIELGIRHMGHDSWYGTTIWDMINDAYMTWLMFSQSHRAWSQAYGTWLITGTITWDMIKHSYVTCLVCYLSWVTAVCCSVLQCVAVKTIHRWHALYDTCPIELSDSVETSWARACTVGGHVLCRVWMSHV